MTRILLTGVSGNGKSTVLEELSRRGYAAIDTDSDEWSVWREDAYGNPDWVWREPEMAALLARFAPAEGRGPLFVGGCKSNQQAFYDRFEQVALLSAPPEVIIRRVAGRTNNPFGRTREDQEMILEHLRDVEPLLRAGASLDLRTDHLSAVQVADVLEALAVGRAARLLVDAPGLPTP